MQLVQVEAYLGPDKPETIAEAVLEIPGYADHREYHYGVVRQDRESGDSQLVQIYRSEQHAIGKVNIVTNSKAFGILTNIRTTPVTKDAEVEACS